jgi:hypothetical protein
VRAVLFVSIFFILELDTPNALAQRSAPRILRPAQSLERLAFVATKASAASVINAWSGPLPAPPEP